MSKLHHPYLANLVRSFQTARSVYFVCEPIHCRLTAVLPKNDRLRENDARFYTAEIFLALDFLHAHNVVYRSLSFENIFLDSDGHVQLMGDHWVKKLEENGKTKSFVGNPEYVPPELVFGQEVEYTKDFDWWGFGAILFRLLTNELPFHLSFKKLNFADEKDFGRLQKFKQSPTQFPKHLSLEATDVIGSLLEPVLAGRLHEGARIKKHAFFKDLPWDKFLKREVAPPFKVPDAHTVADDSNLESSTEVFEEFQNFTFVSSGLDKLAVVS